jgi:hypothetical protein
MKICSNLVVASMLAFVAILDGLLVAVGIWVEYAFADDPSS